MILSTCLAVPSNLTGEISSMGIIDRIYIKKFCVKEAFCCEKGFQTQKLCFQVLMFYFDFTSANSVLFYVSKFSDILCLLFQCYLYKKIQWILVLFSIKVCYPN